MSDNIQTNITGHLTPCLQKKIDKTTYLVEVHFSATSTQSVEDKLKRVIIHDLKRSAQLCYGWIFCEKCNTWAMFTTMPKSDDDMEIL